VNAFGWALFGFALGAALSALATLGWLFIQYRRKTAAPAEEPVLPVPEELSRTLRALRSGAMIIDSSDRVLDASAPAMSLGLIVDQRIVEQVLVELVHQVRRDGNPQKTMLVHTLPGQPARQLTIRVIRLNSQHVLALVEDRTKEILVEAIRRDFVANVSHELMTPVGAIKVLSEAIEDAADDADAVARFAQKMQAESERLIILVRQIIELSRLQTDAEIKDPEEVHVDQIITRVLDATYTDAEAKGIDIVVAGPDRLIVQGNLDQLSAAVGNLVANAVAYSPSGTTVALTTATRPETIEISVSDHGIGIPQSHLDRVFERFYRVDPARTRSTGGTGLGLSIVKHVAASHGGQVKVWSVEGQGSTFTLSLPKPMESTLEGELG
jgi:two-component system sensor histidine kinase SenX3